MIKNSKTFQENIKSEVKLNVGF